jgi:hypothetical protein
MRGLAVAGALLCGCWNFQAALDACEQAGGSCIVDAGPLPPDSGTFDAGVPVWRLVHNNRSGQVITAIYAASADEVWFSDTNDDGSAPHLTQLLSGRYVERYPDTIVNAMAGQGSKIVFGGYYGGAGTNGFVDLRALGIPWDAGTFEDFVAYGPQIDAVWTAGDQLWLAGGSSLFQYSSMTPVPSNSVFLYAGTGIAHGDFWVAGTTGANRFDGPSQVYHFQGSSHAEYDPQVNVISLAAVTPDDIWAVGLGGTVLRFHADGGATLQDAGAFDWYGIYAASPTDVFICGQDFNGDGSGLVAHWNGTEYDSIAGLSYSGLRAIHGTSARDVWAADFDGGLWHYSP